MHLETRIDLPPVVAQRLMRPVMTSTIPVVPFRRDLAQRFQVQPVPERARGERLQLRDNRQPAATMPEPGQSGSNQANIAAEQARERQIADLSREAARGNRVAREQMRQLQQQQQQEQRQQREQAAAQQRTDRMAAQQAQGERVSNKVQNRQTRQGEVPQQPARENRGGRFKEGKVPLPANQQPAPAERQRRPKILLARANNHRRAQQGNPRHIVHRCVSRRIDSNRHSRKRHHKHGQCESSGKRNLGHLNRGASNSRRRLSRSRARSRNPRETTSPTGRATGESTASRTAGKEERQRT